MQVNNCNNVSFKAKVHVPYVTKAEERLRSVCGEFQSLGVPIACNGVKGLPLTRLRNDSGKNFGRTIEKLTFSQVNDLLIGAVRTLRHAIENHTRVFREMPNATLTKEQRTILEKFDAYFGDTNKPIFEFPKKKKA